jgi:transcriptional regulator with XRE-family HTH domain
LGIALRRHRNALKLSQESFAAKVGLHRTYIGAIERGERNVSLKNLDKLASALDVKLSSLMKDAENIRREKLK